MVGCSAAKCKLLFVWKTVIAYLIIPVVPFAFPRTLRIVSNATWTLSCEDLGGMLLRGVVEYEGRIGCASFEDGQFRAYRGTPPAEKPSGSPCQLYAQVLKRVLEVTL